MGRVIMTRDERIQKIESYGKGYVQLPEARQQFRRRCGRSSLCLTAGASTKLSFILLTARQTHMSSAGNWLLNLPNPLRLMTRTNGRWHFIIRTKALELFRRLRLSSYKPTKTLPESVWLNSVGSLENETVTLHDWLEVYEQQIPGHINQMKKRYDAWRKAYLK